MSRRKRRARKFDDLPVPQQPDFSPVPCEKCGEFCCWQPGEMLPDEPGKPRRQAMICGNCGHTEIAMIVAH